MSLSSNYQWKKMLEYTNASKKIHCNLKSMLSFALSKLKPINQLVTTIMLQPKSPIPNITDKMGKQRHKTGY
jgi:hypothetical protein